MRELVATAVGSASTPAKMSNSGKRVHFEVDGMDGTPMPVKDVYRAFRRTRPRAPASNRITDEYLQDVAEVYRQALDRGDPPTQTVADVFVLPRPTAARHVGMARKKEFLGSTTPGRKGEAK